MRIRHIDTIPLRLTIIPDVAPHLYRSGHVGQITLYRIHLDNGVVGYGEDVGQSTDVSIYVGRHAVAGLHDIKHGGIQMACYDAVGKALDLPAHALMGRQVRKRVPTAYWSIDLPPDTWASQTRRAVELGYRVYKFKYRPWWDPVEQIERVSQVAPAGFKFWLDFNGHLREARLALPILKALSAYDCVGGFESPIPQRDAAGYRMLRQKIDKPIAAHFGSGCCHVTSDPGFDRGVPANTQISEGLCDGFVLGGTDINAIHQPAAIAAEAKIPFWIQTVGAGLRAAWVSHLASVHQQGILAHLAAHELWEQDIVTALRPESGWVTVPDGPGLGLKVNEDTVEALRGESGGLETRRRISTVVYPDGLKWHFGNEQQRQEAFYFGDLPGFVQGIRLEIWEDDGSDEFSSHFARCTESPVVEKRERH